MNGKMDYTTTHCKSGIVQRPVAVPLICVFVIFQLNWSPFVSCSDVIVQKFPCVPVKLRDESAACVCNATYCDELDPIVQPPENGYWVYTTSENGERFSTKAGTMTKNINARGEKLFVIDHNIVFQNIIGFGGAMTDSAALNINSLTPRARDKLLMAYFSEAGIQYSICRIPFGGTDFSTRGYSYDDGHDGDFKLEHFELQSEDLNYKIPLIKAAQNLSSFSIRLLGTPWSPPGWMKTNKALNGSGQLIGKPGGIYYKAWADYLVRSLKEHAKHGLKFWGLSPQNEPVFAGHQNIMSSSNNLDFPVENLREFIVQDLGPALNANGYSHIKLFTFDDLLIFTPYTLDILLKNGSPVHDYVSGIAFHWYGSDAVVQDWTSKIHSDYPEMILLSTEASKRILFENGKFVPGSWQRAENYAYDILKVLSHWTAGWIDWNIALDLKGGPSWINMSLDSSIVVDAVQNRFYKQALYYILGHFSKFIPPNSKIISITSDCEETRLMAVAAKTPQNSTVVVILNRLNHTKSISMKHGWKYINDIIPAKSIQTYVWW